MTASATPPATPAAMSSGTALLALVAFMLLMIVTGKAETLARLPLVLTAALAGWLFRWLVVRPVRWVLRRLDVRWPQLTLLAVTALLAVQAAPVTGPRLPTLLAATVWGWWFMHRWRAPARQRKAAGQHARAQERQAAALKADAKRLEHDASKAKPAPASALPARIRKQAARGPVRQQSEPAASAPAPVALKERPTPPEPRHWTPPAPPLDPILPRWLGGGLLERRRDR